MTPLDHATPAALFGDAVGDLRSLKRAYAALIREHGPETDPLVFRHVRDLYERATATLAGRALPAPEPVEAPGREEGLAWVEGRLALLVEADLASGIEAFAAEARALPNPAAHLTAAALLEAAAPDRVLSWLRDLVVGRPTSARLVAMVGMHLAARRPAIVAAPEWRALVEACGLPEARVRLGLAEVDALMGLERREAAWEAWEAVEAELRSIDPGAWVQRLAAMFRRVGGGLREDVPDRWIERLESAQLGLSDEVVEWLCAIACDALALGRAAQDPTVPRDLLQTIEDLVAARPVEQVVILASLGADREWSAALAGLEARHPGVVAVVRRVVAHLTQRDVALQKWHAAGLRGFGELPAVDAALLTAMNDAVAASERMEGAARQEERREVAEGTRGGNLALGVAFGAFLGGTAMIEGSTWLLGVLLYAIMAGFFLWAMNGSRVATTGDAKKRARDREAAAITAGNELVLSAVHAACRASGAWLHELDAVAPSGRSLQRVFDKLMSDPLSDMQVIGERHVRRAAVWPPSAGRSGGSG